VDNLFLHFIIFMLLLFSLVLLFLFLVLRLMLVQNRRILAIFIYRFIKRLLVLVFSMFDINLFAFGLLRSFLLFAGLLLFKPLVILFGITV